MHVKSFSLGPLGTNCYLVIRDRSCLIFDPSGDSQVIKEYIEANHLNPVAILLTHAHFDHIGALDDLRKKYGIDVYLHGKESTWLGDPLLNRSTVSLGEAHAIVTDAPEQELEEGNLTIDIFQMEVIHTPGHSPGSVTFIFKDDEFIISGDVLFPMGVGRTDLPGGSTEKLAYSILKKLYVLPEQYKVYPGHNIETSIGFEKEHNPYTLHFQDNFKF